MSTSANPSRRRFRFTLRKLLFIVMVFGIALGWLGAQLNWIRKRREARQWIMPLRARQLAVTRGDSPPPLKGRLVAQGGKRAPWSLTIFGESGVERIEVDKRWFASNPCYNVDDLRSLFPEAEIVLKSTFSNR